MNQYTDPIATWNLVGSAGRNLSLEDKISAVKNIVFPLGMNGTAVELDDEIKGPIKVLVKKGWRNHCFNEFVSDLIPVNRTLPDYRDEWCKQRNYSKNLPEVSVVICFHNEAWSVLLRTIESVLHRSPPDLLKEIILIDDFSSMRHLNEDLENYVRTKLKVVLIRAIHRKGLIRARIMGAKYASGTVVVFLDSHCECTKGWLEPLLEQINKDPKTVVSPVVDHLDVSTFQYIPQTTDNLQIGGFEWDLKFIWRPVPKSILETRTEKAAPIKTPTISGGLFAIHKQFFKHLGYYDSNFDIWGGENLELSFKTWMCGGSLEIVPCSHVGHVFRSTFPYKHVKKSLMKNSLRLAEVWLDDYAKYYYQRIGDIRENFGDVTKRRKLREKLKCKSFEWYLHNVYPDMKLPDENVAYGQIYNMGEYPACLDVISSTLNIQGAVSVQPCHFEGGNQFWVYTKNGRIEHDDMCLNYIFGFITMVLCDEKMLSQVWFYDDKIKSIKHNQTKLCLTIIVTGKNNLNLELKKCANLTNQEWTMDNYKEQRLLPELRSSTNKPSNTT
ncbi:putative polypeptide N-acetylgalactosaminyltransferase 9 [Colias croceus]|uniref:putative polypeptide N-acetylgalactosaminyltransferase 9 n=1 Tax=Colias crocea TaxID=72248 RepID=UPI001E27B959|nr:putative polypeptide N-acetylgalactosaminyltransferase 9 [Colias croceus]